MKNIFKKFGVLAVLMAFLIGLAGGSAYRVFASATTLRVVQTPTTTLYAGQSGVATSIRITPYPKDLNGTKLTITDFGSSPTFTVDPKVSGIEEIESFTTIVDNGDNTATLSGLTRNLTSKYPYTTSGTGRSHGAGAIVVFGNNPQLYGRLAALENDQSFTGTDTFNIPPIVNDTNASSTSQVASRAYVLSVAFGSVPIQTSAGGTGLTNSTLPVNAFLYYPGTGSTLVGSTTPYVGSIVATTTTATSTFAGQINVTGASTSTFSGNVAVTGALTASATTTFSANSSNKVILNGLPYTLQATRAASSTVLSEDGSGNLTFETPSVSILYSSSAAQNTLSTTTVTIAANTFIGQKKITASWCGVGTGGAGDSLYAVRIGSGSSTTTVQTITNSNGCGQFTLGAVGTNSESYYAILNGGGTLSTNSGTTLSLSTSANIYIAFAANPRTGSAQIDYALVTLYTGQ